MALPTSLAFSKIKPEYKFFLIALQVFAGGVLAQQGWRSFKTTRHVDSDFLAHSSRRYSSCPIVRRLLPHRSRVKISPNRLLGVIPSGKGTAVSIGKCPTRLESKVEGSYYGGFREIIPYNFLSVTPTANIGGSLEWCRSVHDSTKDRNKCVPVVGNESRPVVSTRSSSRSLDVAPDK